VPARSSTTTSTASTATVDREHLHVSARDRHLIHGAARAAAVPFGRVTAEIGLAVTGTDAHLRHKRAAMVAHASQIGDEDVPAVDQIHDFAGAYGYEWFTRSGNPGPLDALGNAHLLARVPA
jgi:hypothetical protein